MLIGSTYAAYKDKALFHLLGPKALAVWALFACPRAVYSPLTQDLASPV